MAIKTTTAKLGKAPKMNQEFVKRYPDLAAAWDLIRKEETKGPLDRRTARLIKLAIAIGAMREGAVHAAVRKARAEGATEEEIDQVIALAASTLGMPSTVAIFSWIREMR